MITLTNLRKIYRQKTSEVVALDGVSLEVRPGEVFGVLGQSGAGKSTLIRCVNLLERPTEGTVVVDGQELTTLSGAALRKARQRIGMIFQHFNLLSSRTVADNIALPLEVMGRGRKERQARVAELLALVGLEDKARAYPAQLSGGQKQRVGIARALAGEPHVLLSDEATSALDPETTQAILQLLRDLNQRLGLTILLITHEMAVVRQICDRVAVLEAGRVVEQGAVDELVARPGTLLGRTFFAHANGHIPRSGARIATLTFVGEAAERPLLTTLGRRFEVDVSILSGSVEKLGYRRVGQLQVELVGAGVDPALQYLREHGMDVKVH
ncbi:MAG: ATP-binding cassette domain-containing protein [Chloroflexales bacterium]|nr:ATP-binding cassette domain-containing protein [Chloroflexales bacterium]